MASCFHCGRGLGASPVRCESPAFDLVFYLCWHCFEGYVYEGGYSIVPHTWHARKGVADAPRA